MSSDPVWVMARWVALLRMDSPKEVEMFDAVGDANMK
jgi:hypothetical protein